MNKQRFFMAGMLWVSFSAADLKHPNAAGFPLKSPMFSSGRSVIFQVSEEILPELSQFMHKNFGRCGGFFTHETKAQAQADLKEPAVRAGGPYTIDQKEIVEPLVSRVREAGLRAVIESMAAHHNRYYQSDTGIAASKWLQGRWQALAKEYPGATVELVNHSGWKQPSVVLTLPGSEKADEVVVLGGHLDSISGFWGGGHNRAPGADDNASGIAVITEALRILTDAGWKPKRTVQFMGYAAEEVGLRGSNDIAQQYSKAGKKVVGVIQFDMTNFKGSPKAVYLLTDNVDSNLTAFLGQLMDTYVRAPWGTTKCGYGCSDHASWTRSGFSASAAFEATFDGMNNNLHTEGDTLANSGGNADHSVNFAKLAIAFAIELAKTK